MKKTPLERWIAQKILGSSNRELTEEAISRYHLERLKQTISYVSERSLFYRKRLAGPARHGLNSLEDFAAFPFTTVEDIKECNSQFLCVSQGQVERVVTIPAPEAGGKPRRFYFSREDLELTVDFFHHGMTTLVEPGWKVLILLPGERPGSVGNLLSTALVRTNVEGIMHGIVSNPARTINEILRQGIECLVGIPTQVLSLARNDKTNRIAPGLIKSVLLVGDHVSPLLVRELTSSWGCRVFTAYTATAMGYGAGVECEALGGYHLPEADIYFEIVDPVSGLSQAPGVPGEIVITTLTRTAMPLVRFRTGDVSRLLPDACPCGTILRRMQKLHGRMHDMVRLSTGDRLGMPDLDHVLFSLPTVVNYFPTLVSGDRFDRLEIAIYSGSDDRRPTPESVTAALLSVPVIARAVETDRLIVEPIRFTNENRVTTCASKRTIAKRTECPCRSGGLPNVGSTALSCPE